MTTRRALLGAVGGLGLAALASGCVVVDRDVRIGPSGGGMQQGTATLAARPGDTAPAVPSGPVEQRLGVAQERDSLLHVPPGTTGPVPLVVSLHGAGGSARGGLDLLKSTATEHGFAVLAPSSRGSTWDAIRDGYGPDVDVLDRSLQRAFELVPVDPQRIAVSGFSDGASYALGLGLANGDLFGSIVAFSPGFVPPADRTGTPRIFVSHGTGDGTLPIDRTSRRIVPRLETDGYDVTYEEFDGGHAVPPRVVRRAVEWLGW